MLMRLATGYAVDQRHVQTLDEQYAADAAVEYGIQRVLRDPTLNAQLATQKGTPFPLSVPAPVNSINPTLQVTLVEKQLLTSPWPWAIWARSEVLITKNNTVIYGDVHCNGPVTITGNNTVINGDVEANEGYQPYPLSWDIADMRPGGTWAAFAAAEGKYYEHTQATWTPTLGDDLVPGLHYATGNVVIDDNNVNCENITLVAEGTIRFTKNKNDLLSPYVPGLILFSNSTSTGAILIDGNKFSSSGGVLYAPNGTIDVAANNAVLDAILVADRVVISKNDAIIQSAELSVGGTTAGACYTFDVRGTAGTTQIDSRIHLCEDELQVLSWAIQ
jgi:hypothetical protein